MKFLFPALAIALMVSTVSCQDDLPWGEYYCPRESDLRIYQDCQRFINVTHRADFVSNLCVTVNFFGTLKALGTFRVAQKLKFELK